VPSPLEPAPGAAQPKPKMCEKLWTLPYGSFLAASCPNGSFEHLPSKSGQLFEQRGAGHQVNILHRFCTSERSVFMPRSAANCLWNFCDYRQMYLIVWLFLVGGRGIEPLTPSMSRKCSSAELTAR
jgi:hypothetical protein